MARIFGFIGSPRNNGNTAVLVNEFVDAAAQAGAETNTVLLNTLQMRGCQSCYQCKTAGVCAVQDDMTPLYAQIANADVVVFASPIYMGMVTAQLTLLLNRLYPYLNTNFTSRLAPGKTAVLMMTQGNPDPAMYQAHFQSLSRMLHVVGFTQVEEVVVAAGLRDPGAAAKNDELMARVRDLGARLTRGYELAVSSEQ